MSYQSDSLNLAKQFILSKANVSSSGERFSEEKPELILKKKEIFDNSNISAAQKNSKIGELLLTQEDNTEGSIIADALWINSGVPNIYKDAKAQLFSRIEQLLPADYSPKLKNDAKTLFDILNIDREDISREQKISKVYQLLKQADLLTVQTTVNEAVTSPAPGPAAHNENLLDPSFSLTKEMLEVPSFTTSAGHRNGGILNRLFVAPFMRLYGWIQAADRLVTGESLQSEPSQPGFSGGQLMKKAFILHNQHHLIQESVQWSEISSIPVKTVALSSFNQSLSNTVPQVGSIMALRGD